MMAWELTKRLAESHLLCQSSQSAADLDSILVMPSTMAVNFGYNHQEHLRLTTSLGGYHRHIFLQPKGSYGRLSSWPS